MAVANRVQVALVRESTPGVTPVTPRMRKARLTSESLTFTPNYIDPNELRSDRMLNDPIKVMQASTGGINMEISFPDDNSPLSEIYRSAFFNPWVNTPFRDNDGTADSVITGVATAGTVLTVLTGDAFVAGQLARFTGFGVAGNNGVFKVTTGSATVPAFVGSGITDEAAPPAAARVKVVGFQGAAADITALADGLGSTLLDFTTLGLALGQWVKIGGSADGTTFAFLVTAGTAARASAYARVTAISATKLTLDNLPTGWTTDSGTGKTISVFFGDQIRNGVTETSLSIEKGFLDQSVPTYIINTGMQVNTLGHTITSRQVITAQAAFIGMGGGESTTPLDASPDAATTGRVMAANANVGLLAENGTRLTNPNWSREVTFQINNNLRTIESVDQASPVLVNPGECTVTGLITTYFGSDVILAKLYAGTVTSLNSRITKDSQTLVYQFPRVTLTSGDPMATGKNTDVTLASNFSASIDTVLTQCSVLLDRMEYVE